MRSWCGLNAYVDTSALAKWYINEDGSAEVEAFLAEACPVWISLLTKAEMKSLVARRGRDGDLDPSLQARILATFEADIAGGYLVLAPHTVESFLSAEAYLGMHPEIPLATLDALHLGVMTSAGIRTLMTADRVMAQAATALGLDCRRLL